MPEDDDNTLGGAADAFAALDDEPLREEDETPLDDGADEGIDEDQSEGDEPEDEQEDEPEAPAIDAPASWNADAKARFAKLPPDDQRYIADRESERDRFVNAKAMEAAEHRKTATAATQQFTQLHRHYAEQLESYAQQFNPQRPDPSMIATDPVAYSQHLAYYEQAVAQREQITQQASQAQQYADQLEQRQTREQQEADNAALMQAIPEWGDMSKRVEVLTPIVETARALGFTDDLINQARSVDILAMRQAAEWKADAEKFRALQGKRMEAVRAAKSLPKTSKPGTAQPRGSGKAQGFQDSMTRLRKSGDVADAAKAFSNLR